MGKKIDVRTDRDPHHHVQWCEQQGCAVRQTGSSHVVVTAPNGVHGSIPCSKELRKGMHHALLKAYVAMGLLAVIGLVYWGWPVIQQYLVAA